MTDHPDRCANAQIASTVEASESEAGTVIVTGCNRRRRLVAYHRLNSPSGALIAYGTVSMPLSVILTKTNIYLGYHIFVIVLASILMVWTTRQMDSAFVSPVQSLVSMADRISVGDLDARYEGSEPSLEVAVLSSALSHMAGTLQEREARLVYLGQHDTLTGSKNRFYLENQLPALESKDALPLALMLINVNNMRLVNDIAGDEEGDRLIRLVADCIMGRLEDGQFCVRWHGDEFLVVMPNTGTTKATGIGDTIISDVSNSERTHETEEHSARMAKLARALGERLGMNSGFSDDLELLCALHDVGKVGIPDEVLLKPGPLDENEWLIMRTHPEVGARIVEGTPELAHIAESILCHHERWDGKGYPKGLPGSKIPLISRILAVVDAYDAMVNDRAYRKAIRPDQALAEITRCSGTQFDPIVATEFVTMMKEELGLA